VEWTCDLRQIAYGQVKSIAELYATGQTRFQGLPIRSSMPRPAGAYVDMWRASGTFDGLEFR
jgi:hypothetical protein